VFRLWFVFDAACFVYALSMASVLEETKEQMLSFLRNGDHVNNFDPVADISKFKRSFHAILHVEYRARHFQHRHKPRSTHNAIFR
jgi:hypothetical protein